MRTRKNRTSKNIGKSKKLHLCTFKTPTKRAVDPSERGDSDCAFTRRVRNGVKRRLRKKISRKRGGKVMGYGTFGVVYGEKRLPCEGETIDSIDDNEVSKLVKTLKEADDEFNAAQKLKTAVNYDNSLEQKFILPRRVCKVDKKLVKKPPYTDPNWIKNTAGESFKLPESLTASKSIFEFCTLSSCLPKKEEAYTYITISEKGGLHLENYFKNNVINLETFFSFIIKLFNILEGIQLLQTNNFIHGDMKPANCLAIGEGANVMFKIIDLADVQRIEDIENAKFLPTNFFYPFWPAISAYTALFDTRLHDTLPNKISMNTDILAELFKMGYPPGGTSFYDHFMSIDGIFDTAFNTKFTQKEIFVDKYGFINKLKQELESQKTFGKGIAGWEATPADNDVIKTDVDITGFLNNFNTQLASGKLKDNEVNMDLVKIDLFKRIDIYSFGIIILYSIGQFYKKFILNADELKNNDKTKTVLMMLYKIVEMCCIQRDVVAKIDDIVTQYSDLVKVINAPQKRPNILDQGY